MKKLLFILSFVFMLAGCNKDNNLKTETQNIKQELIKKADAGDVKAMLELNKEFLFMKTIEGVQYYSRWYNLVLKSDNPEDILAFTKIFKLSYFINGFEKYAELRETAFKIIDSKNILKLMDTDPNSPEITVEELLKLQGYYRYLGIYNPGMMKHDKSNIDKQLKKKGYQSEREKFEEFEKQVKRILLGRGTREDAHKKIRELLHSILLTNDQSLIFKVGSEYLGERTIPLFKKLIEFDDKNILYYKKLAESYLAPYKGEEKYEAEIIKTLKNAAYLDDYDSTLKLLKLYTKAYDSDEQRAKDLENGRIEPVPEYLKIPTLYTVEPSYVEKLLKKYYIKFFVKKRENPARLVRVEVEFPEEYPNFIKKISKMNEAKRALGDFYISERWYDKTKYNKGNEILNELARKKNKEAQMGNKEAMLSLSRGLKSSGDNEKLAYKWANYIIESRNPLLIAKLKKAIKYFDSDKAKEIKNKIELLHKTNKAFIAVEGLSDEYNEKSTELKKLQLKELVESGVDITILHLLAKNNLQTNNLEKIKESITSYGYLAKKGDFNAYYKLARFYNSSFAEKQNMKNVDKALMYYEKGIELGDISPIKKVFCIYACGKVDRSEHVEEDDKKMIHYTDKLVLAKKHGDVISDLAKIYYSGKYGLQQSYQKAAYYYIKSAEAGYKTSYIKAALIYKEQFNNTEKYLYYLKMGGEAGDSSAYFELGKYYQAQNDNQKALESYINSFNHKSANAGIMLGYFHETGRLGLTKDVEKALEYYKESYKLKRTSEAAMNIGLIYHYGKGEVDKNFKLAEKWYLKSNLEQAKRNLKDVRKLM